MKTVLAVILSAALIWLAPAESGQLNNSVNSAKTQAVQAEVPRKEPTHQVVQEKAQTEQQVEPKPETVEATPEPVKVQELAPQVTQTTGCEKYRDIIDNYSWNADVAIAVCNAESSGNPNNQNFSDYHAFANCRGSFGLFQINCSHGQVYDATENIRIAAAMYDASGWKPWSFTTCKYKVSCY
ncbi:MAG TPA: hypothetical protein VJ836_00575 [Candidatus Saccharimonadales bacterium]|nr:hypothetical protein [Candidatus Saccharimonadales bacterium]